MYVMYSKVDFTSIDVNNICQRIKDVSLTNWAMDISSFPKLEKYHKLQKIISI